MSRTSLVWGSERVASDTTIVVLRSLEVTWNSHEFLEMLRVESTWVSDYGVNAPFVCEGRQEVFLRQAIRNFYGRMIRIFRCHPSDASLMFFSSEGPRSWPQCNVIEPEF